MSGATRAVLIVLLALAGAGLAAGDDPVARADAAKALYQQGQYGEALAIWQELIDKHKRHKVVADGDAYREAAACLRQQGMPGDAARLLERYLKTYPKGPFAFYAETGAFDAWVEAGDAAAAQKIGKRIFKRYPDAKGTFPVLRTWIERGWTVPKLKTSYDVLHYWTFDRIVGKDDPELRLAFLDLIEKWHKGSVLVKDRGILYCRAWCEQQAGRPEEALELGEKYLRAEPTGPYADRVRLVMAWAHLATTPPDPDAAKALIEPVAKNPQSKQQAEAKDLLTRVDGGASSIQIEEGFPTADGLGKVVLLTNLVRTDARRKALEPWIEARGAEVVGFRGRDVKGAAKALQRHGAEFVAVAVDPATLDNDFQLAMLELARGLDDDPMPDFHYGYLVARDAVDLGAFVRRILEKEAKGGTVAREIAPPQAGAKLAGIDFFLHYGHGTPRGIVGAVSAAEAAALSLPDFPVVFSGACFNGVCSKSFETSLNQYVFLKPSDVPVDEALSLAWVHAAATGVLGALDGDRGEMAGAEWEHFLEHAPPLGAVIGHQYRLVFTSLNESFSTFPRYTPGRRMNKSFYHVMLRGQTSRILISDPSYRPLKAPLSAPTLKTEAVRTDDGGVRVTVEVLRHVNGPFVNTLPTTAGIPWREARLYARVALPEGFTGKLAFPTVDVGGLELTKVQAKHEVWGGRRWVNVQAESLGSKLVQPGTVATYTFKPAK